MKEIVFILSFCSHLFMTEMQSDKKKTFFDYMVTPPIINLKARPGSTSNMEITIENRSANILPVRILTANLTMDLEGHARVANEKDSAFSCKSWLKIPNQAMQLPAKSKTVLPITISLPYSMTGGRYAIVMVHTQVQTTEKREIILAGQMGSIIMLETIGRKKIDAQIKEFDIREHNHKTDFAITVLNTGDIHFQAKGSIIIYNESGRIIDRIPLNAKSGTVLPAHPRIFRASWEHRTKRKTGNYQAVVRMHIPGLGKALQDKRSFTIV